MAWPSGLERVLVWIRAFRKSRAGTETLRNISTYCGETYDENRLLQIAAPPQGATISRLVELTAPSSMIANVRVVLSLACMGAELRFAERQTCIDQARPMGSASEGIHVTPDDAAAPPRIMPGTSPLAQVVPCRGQPPVGAPVVCVKGGFTLMGDLDLLGTEEPHLDPAPLRAMYISPFFMDAAEFTVERLRPLATSPEWELPVEKSAVDGKYMIDDTQLCTWSKIGGDRLPVNCLPWASADAICRSVQGMLPSEAQWEHAARGHGHGFLYPWGNQPATACCTSSLARAPYNAPNCGGPGPEPVDSHPAERCDGVGDVSLDGVKDLAGSLRELLRDPFRSRMEEESLGCIPTRLGVVTDPECVVGVTPKTHGLRGHSFKSDLFEARVTMREEYFLPATDLGFRCIYPNGGM